MPIDPSIALNAGMPRVNVMEQMLNAERMKSMRADRERGAWEMEQAQAEAERKSNARATLAQLILGQSPGAPGMQQPSGNLAQLAGMTPPDSGGRGLPGAVAEQRANAAPEMQEQPNAWADYVKYDPEGALDFRATTQDWTKDQFDLAKDLNEGVLQILSGVYDQASFERGKNKARALYGRFGLRLDDMQLPDEFSPDLVRQMQMEAMDTKNQLATVRAERKLDWDIEDDEIDNARMGEREADLAKDRAARREQARRAAERRDATTRRGQDLTDSRVRSGAGRGGSSGAARPTATDAKGNKVEWNGKAWVPVK